MNTGRNVELSEWFRARLLDICTYLGIKSEKLEGAWWNDSSGIRKLGHIIEYGLLGIGAGVAIDRKRWAVITCIAVSILDQVIKVFVPIRHFDITDLPFDAIGAVLGIMIVTGVQRLISRKNRKNRLKAA